MMKVLGLTLIAVNIVIVLIGLACSAVSALGYTAIQRRSNLLAFVSTATPSPTPVAATVTPKPTSPSPSPATPTATATSPPAVAAVEKKNEVEYYRGIFDICVHFGRRSDVPPDKILEACQELVRRTMRQEWYEAPSENWQWPLPQSATDPDALNG